MKYIGLDLHKRKIFVTVLDVDGTILARNIIGTNKQDIYYYLNNLISKDNISIAIETSYNCQYTYRIVENITDNIALTHPSKTRIIGEAKVKNI